MPRPESVKLTLANHANTRKKMKQRRTETHNFTFISAFIYDLFSRSLLFCDKQISEHAEI